MRVHVDETRSNDQSFRFDLAFARAGRYMANAGDLVAKYCHIRVKPGIAGAIDNTSAAQDQVIRRISGDSRQGERKPQTSGHKAEDHPHIGLNCLPVVKRDESRATTRQSRIRYRFTS